VCSSKSPTSRSRFASRFAFGPANRAITPSGTTPGACPFAFARAWSLCAHVRHIV
jgi:hypothetical protein